MRRALLSVVAACLPAGCGDAAAGARGLRGRARPAAGAARAGGGAAAPGAEALVGCLRAGGASVELDPEVTDEVGADGFAPQLTPDTEIAARGELASGTKLDALVGSGGGA